MQFEIVAIGADEDRGQVARERQTAAFAERRADEADVRPAFRAHVAVVRLRTVFAAKLADGRIQQVQAIPQHAVHGEKLFRQPAAPPANACKC